MGTLTTEARRIFTEITEKNNEFTNAEALRFGRGHRGSARVLHFVNSVKRSFSARYNNKNFVTSVKILRASVVKFTVVKN